jgi:ribosome maturation factor RimP
MKEKIASLVNESIKELNVYVTDAFISTEEGKKVFNIVLDSEEIIDLNKITDASRIINKIMDKNESLLEDADELDIYSQEKGEIKDEQ